jgi:hypothetical protein
MASSGTACAKRGYGRIVNVASLAGHVPGSAGHTLYAASKAYLIKFSQSLALENLDTGVHVCALCPGFTRSEFHDVTGTRPLVSKMPDFMWQSAEDVVQEGIRAVERGEAVHVTGTLQSHGQRALQTDAGQACAEDVGEAIAPLSRAGMRSLPLIHVRGRTPRPMQDRHKDGLQCATQHADAGKAGFRRTEDSQCNQRADDGHSAALAAVLRSACKASAGQGRLRYRRRQSSVHCAMRGRVRFFQP